MQRPAAIEQLKRLGADVGVAVHPTETGQNPVAIAGAAMEAAYAAGYDTVILDTAGRLHIDAPLMEELKAIKEKAEPKEILLVADAMTGQDAVQVGQSFNDLLQLTGVILTKVEGDARGGAALSMREVVGKPIKFLGVGEKLDALEEFHPDRLASRILGMGDVLSLIEKAQEAFDADEVKALEQKLRKEAFTLDDFRQQLRQIKKMGSMEQLLGMIPGLGSKMKAMKDMKPDEGELKRVEAIISSMTPGERADYQIINGSRRRRIALGSGTSVQDVNRLLKNFAMTQKMIKQVAQGGKKMKGDAQVFLRKDVEQPPRLSEQARAPALTTIKPKEEKAALMALRIRLARFGAKKRPFYRIVVTNSESPRDGRFLEIIGTYDPNQDPAVVTVKEDLLSQWVSKGATPTDTVASLLKKRPVAAAASEA